MENLSITYKDPGALTPQPRNPRTHSEAQIRQIADSITTFGFTNPILVDRSDKIVAGHGRVAAAKLLDIDRVPTICLEDLTPEQIRAYVIADNKLAENAGWDPELLALELQELEGLNLDFDLTVVGFEAPEIDVLISGLEHIGEEDDPADTIFEPSTEPAVTQAGDIWHIGAHRLICGDATDPGVYERLLAGERAQMVFTDPPYNVPIEGHVSGLGQHKHREFAMASGEMTEAAFTEFLAVAFRSMAAHSLDGAIHFICMDWRHIGEIIAAQREIYSAFKNMCVWAKTNGGMGSLYRSQHELVFVFKVGTGPHINNIELGKHGRNRTNLWTYAGANSFGGDRDDELAMHPTVKPVALVRDAILDCSHRDGVVLDPFAGSGTTLVAAHQTGRRGYAIELDPTYCDLIVRRMADTCGVEAVNATTGKTFKETERARLAAGNRTIGGEDDIRHG